MDNNNKKSAFFIFSWILVAIFILIIIPPLCFALYALLFKEKEVMDVVRVFAFFLLLVLVPLSIIPIRIVLLNRKIWHYQKLNNVDGMVHYFKKLEFLVVSTYLVLFVLLVCVIIWAISFQSY